MTDQVERDAAWQRFATEYYVPEAKHLTERELFEAGYIARATEPSLPSGELSAATLGEVARYVGVPFDRAQALLGVLQMVATAWEDDGVLTCDEGQMDIVLAAFASLEAETVARLEGDAKHLEEGAAMLFDYFEAGERRGAQYGERQLRKWLKAERARKERDHG